MKPDVLSLLVIALNSKMKPTFFTRRHGNLAVGLLPRGSEL
jgi:hypothetical protein